MSQTELLNEARRLAVADRLALIDQLLESVALDEAGLAPEIEAELDRRYRVAKGMRSEAGAARESGPPGTPKYTP